jgi:hypothetical protein
MSNKTIIFRIRLRDWKGIRKIYKGIRGETTAEYFERLNKFLKQEWGNDGSC